MTGRLRRAARWVVAGSLLAGAAAVAAFFVLFPTAPALADDRPTTLRLKPLETDPRLLAEYPARWVAAHEISAPGEPSFGGLSGLLLEGETLRAVGDRGVWLTARARRGPSGEVTALEQARIGPLRDAVGAPLDGPAADAESLARAEHAGPGVWVGFERRHRLSARASVDAQPAAAAEAPRAPVERLGGNAGLEGLARAADGALWAVAEAADEGESRNQGWRYPAPVDASSRPRRFTYARLDEFDATGA
ncbi:MAG: esterase-like activity of phytase family protein, partial [Pseudomonadota bacterium]